MGCISLHEINALITNRETKKNSKDRGLDLDEEELQELVRKVIPL